MGRRQGQGGRHRQKQKPRQTTAQQPEDASAWVGEAAEPGPAALGAGGTPHGKLPPIAAKQGRQRKRMPDAAAAAAAAAAAPEAGQASSAEAPRGGPAAACDPGVAGPLDSSRGSSWQPPDPTASEESTSQHQPHQGQHPTASGQLHEPSASATSATASGTLQQQLHGPAAAGPAALPSDGLAGPPADQDRSGAWAGPFGRSNRVLPVGSGPVGPEVTGGTQTSAGGTAGPAAAPGSGAGAAQQLRLGTWNAEMLSLNSKVPDNCRNQRVKMGHMATQIVAEGLELVALQEVTCHSNGVAALTELVALLDREEAERGDGPGTQWRFIDHLQQTFKQGALQEMGAFLYKHRRAGARGGAGRVIFSATSHCLVLSGADRDKYTGSKGTFQRTPAYARFFVRDLDAAAAAAGSDGGGSGAPAAELSSAAAQQGSSNVHSLVLMSVHVKAQEGKHMGGTARDLQMLGKMAKAIRMPNEATLGGTPVVMLGDFNQDCGNEAVFKRIIAKGWRPALPPGVATNTKGESQFDNIWAQAAGPESSDSRPGLDHGLVHLDTARVVPKPDGVAKEEYSNHCLLCTRLHLLQPALRGLTPPGPSWQDPLDRAWQAGASGAVAAPEPASGPGDLGTSGLGQHLFLEPNVDQAYEGRHKALLSQVVLPRVGIVPRLGGLSLPFWKGKRWYACVCVDEAAVQEAKPSGL